MLFGNKGFSLIELCIALGILSSILLLANFPIKNGLHMISSKNNLHAGLHFVDHTRTLAKKTYTSISYSPEALQNQTPFTSLETSNSNGMGFTPQGSQMYLTSLLFESGDSISIPASSIGKFNLNQ